eukprot:1037041-Pleurochrysis_carterae.AAC.1
MEKGEEEQGKGAQPRGLREGGGRVACGRRYEAQLGNEAQLSIRSANVHRQELSAAVGTGRIELGARREVSAWRRARIQPPDAFPSRNTRC